jgi:hypothetical protein
MDLSSDEHGDEAEMSGKGGVVRGLDWRDGGFAGFDGVEEVAAMLGGFVELNLAEVVGEGIAL